MAATHTQKVINAFTTHVDTEKEYTRAELGKILTAVYHQIVFDKPKKTDDDKPKKKKGTRQKSRPKPGKKKPCPRK